MYFIVKNYGRVHMGQRDSGLGNAPHSLFHSSKRGAIRKTLSMESKLRSNEILPVCGLRF